VAEDAARADRANSNMLAAVNSRLESENYELRRRAAAEAEAEEEAAEEEAEEEGQQQQEEEELEEEEVAKEEEAVPIACRYIVTCVPPEPKYRAFAGFGLTLRGSAGGASGSGSGIAPALALALAAAPPLPPPQEPAAAAAAAAAADDTPPPLVNDVRGIAAGLYTFQQHGGESTDDDAMAGLSVTS
jgi:hypothetical protein